MTISPPAKVNGDGSRIVQVLAWGLDTLHVALDVAWESEFLFRVLAAKKEAAAAGGKPEPLGLTADNGELVWALNVEPYGVRGYEWLLRGREFNMRVGNWLKPSSRPSVIVEFGSEALWREGPARALMDFLAVLRKLGGQVVAAKASRVDICVDVLLAQSLWSTALLAEAVTRAKGDATHRADGQLTGLQFGKGKVLARLYDKAAEILCKSGKRWMFDVWGLQEVLQGRRVIRVEYQLRREALRELGLGSVADVLTKAESLWAYCTAKWLKFQSGTGKHHTQRTTEPWWVAVQQGFRGAQADCPLVRAAAVERDIDALCAQFRGYATSLLAACLATEQVVTPGRIEEILEQMIPGVLGALRDNAELADDVLRKIAKYRAARSKYVEALAERAAEDGSGEMMEQGGLGLGFDMGDAPCPF